MMKALSPSAAESLRGLLDIVPDMCFVISADQKILDCNQRARAVTGLPVQLDGSIPFASLLTPDSPRPPFDALDDTNRSCETEVRFRQDGRRAMDALVYVNCMRVDAGRQYVVFGRDISGSKQRELDLLRFANVVHYTVNPIQITDGQGRMIYVNPAFERTTGFTKEELIGRNPSIISSKKYGKEFWERVWTTISAGRIWNGEIENRRKDGEPLYTQLLISPIMDVDGNVVGYLGSHRDVTEQRALEQQLMHSQKMESIGTLAAGIAHEVGNPLTSISSIVQVLQRTMNDEFARDKLALVQSQVHRITKIIRDLVDFSRPSNYQVQPTDIVKVLTDSVEIVKMGKKAKEVTFYTHVRHQIPLLSLVPDQIAQVFINILLNAVDALQGKRGTITTNFERDEDLVRVTIADDGAGIDPDHLSKIFEPFFTTKRVGEGTGLGLWVSYGIVKSFRGDITVKSEQGEGTSFCVTLPLHPEDYTYG
jgi:PAS domain S-box-containing protein